MDHLFSSSSSASPRPFAVSLRRVLLLSALLLSLVFALVSGRRHHQYQHFGRQSLEEVPPAPGDELGKMHRRTPKIICLHGSPIGGRCVCDQGWAGMHCQREMHCATFERTSNGSCANCQTNFNGDRCEHLDCQNGGTDQEDQQTCQCAAPYSGQFCEELLTGNVYYYYNSKVATLGPLGLLAVIPMIGTYVVCERFARKRQVRRIEKTWNQQSKSGVNAASIEFLLKEKH